MAAVFEHTHTVTPGEIDGVGHVNNIEYLRWLQDAAIAHSSLQGWPSRAYHELGMGWVVRSHFIEYLVPAFVGDQIVVRTWIADMKRVTSMRRYELFRPVDGKQLAVASTNWAFVNFKTLQPCRVPAEVIQSFEIVPDAVQR
jgi:acyl-CoA thioester hydrolase